MYKQSLSMMCYSLNNLFAGTQLPQNPGLTENNYNSAHQDSYCSESVGLTGPVSGKLQMITKHNPYGFTPLMTCNSNNQLIGMAAKASTDSADLHLIVFYSECEIIWATEVPTEPKPGQSGSAGKGYFFLTMITMLLPFMVMPLHSFLLQM